MSKFVYEKLKNEDIFLNNFYQSSAYRKLLLELEFCSNHNEPSDLDSHISHVSADTGSAGSDSNSGDIQFDDEFELDMDGAGVGANANFATTVPKTETSDRPLPSDSLIGTTYDLCILPILGTQGKLLDVSTFKHSRSHSDCTGIVQNIPEINANLLLSNDQSRQHSAGKTSPLATKASSDSARTSPQPIAVAAIDHSKYHQRLAAKIINTAINCDGQYAVYAIQVTVIEENQQKSWHVYRRYSRFLDLKKILVKRVGDIFLSTKREVSIINHHKVLIRSLFLF